MNSIEDQELEEDIESHYQVGLIRTEARRKSNMPTSEKDAGMPSRLSSLPLATLTGKTPISIPKTKRKKRKRKQGKMLEVKEDLWHKGIHTYEKDGFLGLDKRCNKVWRLKYPP